jgi:hypothetical protein
MFIMLEGPDGAGKTTLSGQLQKLLPGSIYVHHGPAAGFTSQALSGAYMASMKPAFAGDLVMDRGWLSEPIYGAVYRKAASRVSKAQQRMLERAALALDCKVVLCLPPFEKCAEAFSTRPELLDNSAQLAQVYQAYLGLPTATELPVAIYDYTTGETAEQLLSRLPVRRPPKVVVLCDRPMTRSPFQSKFQVPFVSFTGKGSGEWFAGLLDDAGILEADLAWFNSYSSTLEHLDPARLPEGVPVVALGPNASAWGRAHGVSHQIMPHPHYHKQFHSGKPYPLIALLKELTQ